MSGDRAQKNGFGFRVYVSGFRAFVKIFFESSMKVPFGYARRL